MNGEPRGWAMPFRIGAEGGVAVEAGPEKIRDNVVHILLTGVGERVMRRDYGAGLRQILHDPVNDALLAVVQHRVGKAIAEAEPRVEVNAVRVRAHRYGSTAGGAATPGGDLPGEAVVAEIEFTIRATRQPVSLSVPLSLGGL